MTQIVEQKEDIRAGSNSKKWKVPEIPEKCGESAK